MFQMNIEGSSSTGEYRCFQYDTDFVPEVAEDNRQLRYSIFKALEKNVQGVIGKFAFSGKSLFTLKKLTDAKQKDFDRVVGLEQVNINGINYTMRIRFTREFEITEEELRGENQSIAKKGNKVT